MYISIYAVGYYYYESNYEIQIRVRFEVEACMQFL